MFCRGKAGTWWPPRPLTQHSALVARPAAERNSSVTWSPTALLKSLGDYIPVFCLTQVMSRLRLTTGKIKKWHEDCEKRQGWNTSKAHWDWKHYTEETGIVLKKKKREQREWLNHRMIWETGRGIRRWKLRAGWGSVCVFACMCIKAAQPSQNCGRKGNEPGEKKTGQKVFRR